LKPEAVMLTENDAAVRSGNEKNPSPLVFMDRTNPVVPATSLKSAPGTTAPVGSWTVPDNRHEIFCALMDVAASSSAEKFFTMA
jgi:hypothetical protein